jgi:hypothetical protein
MSILGNRLERLERATRAGCVVVWQQPTDSVEQAKARWRAEHPDADLDGTGLMVIVVGWDHPQ